MTMTESILTKARELAVIKNDTNVRRRDQGVLFGAYQDPEGNTRHEAWLLSEVAIIRWSNVALDFPLEAPWFSFKLNGFTENTSSMRDINELRNLYSEFRNSPSEVFAIPVNATLSVIDKAFNEAEGRFQFIEKSRTIIRNNVGFPFEKEILLQFKNGYFQNPNLLDMEFELSNETRLVPPFQEGRVYRVNKVRMSSVFGKKTVEIDVRDIYVKNVIEVLVHEVVNGVYMPKSDRDVLDSSNYVPERVLRYPYQFQPPVNGYTFDPIYIDTTALFYSLRAFEDYLHAEVFAPSGLRPIILQGASPTYEGLPTVEAIIGVLNPAIRGYYK